MSISDNHYLAPYINKADEDLPIREKRIKAARQLVDDSQVVYVEGEYWVRAYLAESLELDRARHYIASLQGRNDELKGTIDDLENEITEMGEHEDYSY